jgi:hypothetical protein
MLGGCATPSFLSKTPDAADMEDVVIVPDAREGGITKTLLLRLIDDAQVSPDTAWRSHPIYKDERMHEGMNFAAVEGTPISAPCFSSPFTLQRGKENEEGLSIGLLFLLLACQSEYSFSNIVRYPHTDTFQSINKRFNAIR